MFGAPSRFVGEYCHWSTTLVTAATEAHEQLTLIYVVERIFAQPGRFPTRLPC